MIQWEGHTWARNTERSAIGYVPTGPVSELTNPVSFQMAVMTGRQITAAIRGRMKIGPGATGMVVSGTIVS